MKLPFASLQLQAPVLRRLRWIILAMALYSTAVAFYDDIVLKDVVTIKPNLHALLGTGLGILLVFRTNTAYDRWWEGRKAWAQLLADTRNLTFKIRALAKVSPDEAHQFGRLLIGFARALKEHLREGVSEGQVSVIRYKPGTHVPSLLAAQIRARVGEWRRDGKIDNTEDILLDVHTRALIEVCGTCERIRRSPLGPSYRAFIVQSLFLYLATLPWGLIEDFNFWTIPLATAICYLLVSLECIAEEVQEPFGRHEDDILLDDLCQSIEASVKELLPAP